MAPPNYSLDYLENPIVVRLHTFDFPEPENWNLGVTSRFQDGELVITGDGNWGGASYNQQFVEGQGIIFSYRNEQGKEWAPWFANGATYKSQEFLGLGLFDPGYPKLDIIKGPSTYRASNLPGNFSPRLDTWYEIMMAIGKDGHFLVTITNPENPTELLMYQEVLGPEWSGVSWNFGIIANRGVVKVDNLMEISFNNISE